MAVSEERRGGEAKKEKLLFPPCTRPGASSSMTAAAVKVMPGQFHPAEPIQSIQLSIEATFIFFFFRTMEFFRQSFSCSCCFAGGGKMVETETSLGEKFFRKQ